MATCGGRLRTCWSSPQSQLSGQPRTLRQGSRSCHQVFSGTSSSASRPLPPQLRETPGRARLPQGPRPSPSQTPVLPPSCCCGRSDSRGKPPVPVPVPVPMVPGHSASLMGLRLTDGWNLSHPNLAPGCSLSPISSTRSLTGGRFPGCPGRPLGGLLFQERTFISAAVNQNLTYLKGECMTF